MMQRLQKLALSPRILVYAVVAAAVLAVAAGVGATTAILLAPDKEPSGASESRPAAEGEKPGQAGQQERVSDRQSEAVYLDTIGEIQNGAVQASLQSNDKLLHYDKLNPDDIEDLEANADALANYRERVEALDLPEKYEGQYKVFVLAIGELYAANKLAYDLAADPVSATEDDFEAYDRQIDEATSHLRRSNEILNRDYKTTDAAQDVILG